ncbi:MAG TPA: hypothetical protein DEF45_21665 [Rhodopirellula sp.]|nr:hypothetical protein [Rhodopirellula sp.]
MAQLSASKHRICEQNCAQSECLIASITVQQRSSYATEAMNHACILRSFASQGKQGDHLRKLWSMRIKSSNPRQKGSDAEEFSVKMLQIAVSLPATWKPNTPATEPGTRHKVDH